MKHRPRRAWLGFGLQFGLQFGLASGLASVLVLASGRLQAQAEPRVVLAGRMGDRALLMIDGQPQMLAVGQAAAGVKLLRWQDEQALVELNGRSILLRVGGTPAQLNPGGALPASAREIVMPAGPGGHFFSSGAINGRAVQFMVDTGATRVALSQGVAQRLGLDLRNARRGIGQTANGEVPVQLLNLARVRVGAVEINNVDAVVLPAAMPHVLLGNSFLSRFQMLRENDVMRLQLR